MLDVEHKQKKYFKMYEFKADYSNKWQMEVIDCMDKLEALQ